MVFHLFIISDFMNRHSTITALLIVLIALLGINQLLIATIEIKPTSQNQATGAVTRTPISGEKTSYGVTLDNNGFKQLLSTDQTVTLSDDTKTRYQKLINEIPHDCCPGNVQGFAPISACGCGHAQALRGLTKLLIQKGWSDSDIKSEADKWRKLFFSEGSQVGSMG